MFSTCQVWLEPTFIIFHYTIIDKQQISQTSHTENTYLLEIDAYNDCMTETTF